MVMALWVSAVPWLLLLPLTTITLNEKFLPLESFWPIFKIDTHFH